MRVTAWAALACLIVPMVCVGSVTPARAESTDPCDSSSRWVSAEPAAFEQLGVRNAWKLSDGAVRVAVVDSGVNSDNPHLRSRVDKGTAVFGSGDGTTDSYGTGTAIASQIAAAKVEGSGLEGVAPKARIVPVRVFESTQNDATVPNADRIAKGIEWASSQHGVKIIVVGQATLTDSAALRSAVSKATKAGALVVAAAGDASLRTDNQQTGPLLTYPAAYPEVLGVTAVDTQGAATAATLAGAQVSLAAPGMNVLAAQGNGDCVLSSSQPTSVLATGYAGAIAALVAAAHPKESPADWRYRLLATALRPTPQTRNNTTGWGIIAAYPAINFVNDGTRPGPPNPRFPKSSSPTNSPTPLPAPPAGEPIRTQLIAGVLGFGAVAVVAAGLLIGHTARRGRRPFAPGERPTPH